MEAVTRCPTACTRSTAICASWIPLSAVSLIPSWRVIVAPHASRGPNRSSTLTSYHFNAENGFMGMGVGAAMTGLRPIVEGMNMGFLLLAFNQISNNCGMLHYTSGGQFKVPMVIRGPGGVGRQLGAEHSQRLESYFQSIPGVQLVACSTVANAKALFKSVSGCLNGRLVSS